MNVIREALAKEIERLEGVKRGLGERTARYVEDGELLSECYNDMRVIAAAGRGIDPGGEKNT